MDDNPAGHGGQESWCDSTIHRESLARGKALYDTSCAACLLLFNLGGDIGPGLTSFNRRDQDALLLALVNPSAEIREGFENVLILAGCLTPFSDTFFLGQRNSVQISETSLKI